MFCSLAVAANILITATSKDVELQIYAVVPFLEKAT
jgi:hypothetical protein